MEHAKICYNNKNVYAYMSSFPIIAHPPKNQRKYSLYPLSDENLNLISAYIYIVLNTTEILLNKC